MLSPDSVSLENSAIAQASTFHAWPSVHTSLTKGSNRVSSTNTFDAGKFVTAPATDFATLKRASKRL
jgi:hypothetical protein